MNNSLAIHVQSTIHDISWDKATMIEGEQHRLRRKIKEAIHIQSTKCMNLDQGLILDPIYGMTFCSSPYSIFIIF